MSATPRHSAAPAPSEAVPRAAARGGSLLVGATTGALLWVVAIVAAPAWHGRDATRGQRVVAAAVHVMASRICHQRPERSFRVAGQPMPVCGRCAGLYVSGALGLLAGGFVPRRRARGTALGSWPAGLDRRAAWIAVAALPTLATWLLEVAGAWDPGTPLRALAALPLGATAGMLMGRAFRSPARRHPLPSC